MKTSDLIDAALDWAVARCENAGAAMVETHSRGRVLLLADATEYNEPGETYSPSTNWAQGGPIIEREGITVRRYTDALWDASIGRLDYVADGPTPLIAAMRCYVASVMGDEVDVPAELEAA